MRKTKQTHYGDLLEINLGRDKKTGKIIRFSMPIVTTAKTKAEARRAFQKELDKMKKRKGVTKAFKVDPVRIKDKKKFLKHYN